MRKKIVLTIFFALAAAGPAFAEAVTEEKLSANPTIGELVEYAWAHNPEIVAARQDWKGRIENIRVMGAYPDPEFMVEQMGTTNPSWNAKFTFMVPFPGKLGAAADSASTEATAAKVGLDLAARDLAQAIRESAAEASYMQKALKIAAKNRLLLQRLSDLSMNAYAARRAELIDLVKANSMVAKVDFDDQVVGELLTVEKTRLNSRLAREPGAPLGEIVLPPVVPVVFTAEEVTKMAQSRPEELGLAEAQVEKARAEARAARLGYFPDFTLAAFRNQLEKGDENSYGFSVGLTLPIWFGKNSSRTGVAQANLARAEALRDARRLSLGADARELYFRVRNAERLAGLYRETLIPQASRSMELAETWMRGGESSYSDYAEIATTLYGFELALARAEADHAKYLARLESLAGRDLTAPQGQGNGGGK